MEALVQLLKEKHLTIGSVESLTAGMFCEKVANIPGASAVLVGGVVTYATRIKTDVVHVKEETAQKWGVVSSQCAQEMACNGRELLDCDICVSFTGNAGPSSMEGKPCGMVFAAIATKEECQVFEFQLSGSRQEIRSNVVAQMSENLIQFIGKMK